MSVPASQSEACSSPELALSQPVKAKTIKFPKIERPPEYYSWMPCKQQSWDQLQLNPNAFFFRHVLPGETKKNGAWTENEKMLFIQTIRENPVPETPWGLIARKIPGRVGYQCNSFYKKLVASGELQELAPDIPIHYSKVRTEGTTEHISKRKSKIDEIDLIECDLHACDCTPENHTAESVLPKTQTVPNSQFRDTLIETVEGKWKNKFFESSKLYY